MLPNNVKSLAGVSLLASGALAAYDAFEVTSLYTKQPNGNPAGNVNNYVIEFDVTSNLGDIPQSAYCRTLWGDNYCSGSGCVAYSTDVPTGEWLHRCYHNESTYATNTDDGTSPFAFQLYPYFGIGNFSFAIQQDYTTTM